MNCVTSGVKGDVAARALADYHTEITVLSVPVAYASMKNRDIDVFPGNWMHPMERPPG